MTPTTHSLTSGPVFHPILYDPEAAVKAEFGRLIHAAIINPNFRKMLLSNPKLSIETGYCGESFQFSPELKNKITLIKAGTLEEFSTQLLEVVTSTNIPELAVANYQ